MKKSVIFAAIVLVCAGAGASAQSNPYNVQGGDSIDGTLTGPVDYTGTGHAGIDKVPGLLGVGIKMFYDTGSSISTAAQGNFKLKKMPNGSPYWSIGRIVDGTKSAQGYYENEVYFGSWVYDPAIYQPTTWDRAQFYTGMQGSGDISAKNGTVVYDVRGISNYVNGAGTQTDSFLIGSLSANFTTSVLNGGISNASGNKQIAFVNVKIDKASGSYGTAGGGLVIGVQGTTQYNGVTAGHFYGDQAQILAGYATFAGNADLNTAYGGASGSAKFE
ncbi:hypothetical protein [Kerstersia gyiorum]|uniref:hypothetical protein n=1 Tax=Kerstersia gyiorum TaxID=206506 RepID=UPI00209EC925|nr:hypothetical protein [Kerstersia gyiorum]MCP1633776.1 hypothetical protein [Kerstersia gyiorum]MCP1637493.1 hypothetical protein [Kerstersia gyiorum]MCP1671641.1 hypothetical protein [Kerstersia gyiorum]MCP1679465.1 hypothetical protein [Kerstersia gyiorum]MCP1683080.1 hypothetical protein [Kerstersia gyiorum]